MKVQSGSPNPAKTRPRPESHQHCLSLAQREDRLVCQHRGQRRVWLGLCRLTAHHHISEGSPNPNGCHCCRGVRYLVNQRRQLRAGGPGRNGDRTGRDEGDPFEKWGAHVTCHKDRYSIGSHSIHMAAHQDEFAIQMIEGPQAQGETAADLSNVDQAVVVRRSKVVISSDLHHGG